MKEIETKVPVYRWRDVNKKIAERERKLAEEVKKKAEALLQQNNSLKK